MLGSAWNATCARFEPSKSPVVDGFSGFTVGAAVAVVDAPPVSMVSVVDAAFAEAVAARLAAVPASTFAAGAAVAVGVVVPDDDAMRSPAAVPAASVVAAGVAVASAG